jgi:hypothetical protein
MRRTALFYGVSALFALFLSPSAALCDGSLQAGSYAWADSPSAEPRSSSDCSFGSSSGPIDFTVSIFYTCYDPQAHPENMPGGTAFTYTAGTGGILVSDAPGQCYYEATGLAAVPTYDIMPQVAPPIPSASVSGQLYYAVDARLPSITCIAGSWQGMPANICWPLWGPDNPVGWGACPNNIATLNCPANTQPDGTTCSCPSGTTWDSMSGQCTSGNSGCSGEVRSSRGSLVASCPLPSSGLGIGKGVSTPVPGTFGYGLSR